jgi:hypothetical protein
MSLDIDALPGMYVVIHLQLNLITQGLCLNLV